MGAETGSPAVAYTWCRVDPYRKGVTTEGVNAGITKATCKTCLRQEAKGDAAKPVPLIVPFA